MRYLKPFVLLLLLSSLVIAQNKREKPGFNHLKYFDGDKGTPSMGVNTKSQGVPVTQPTKASNISWVLIDFGRFLTIGQPNIRPLTYEPDLNILVHVHQGGDLTGDSGGYSPHLRATYYSYSLDTGATWTRMPDPVNYPDPDISDETTSRATSAWPSSAIWNPDNNLSTAWWWGTWMGDADGEGNYQDAMWVYDFPVFDNSPVNNRAAGGPYNPALPTRNFVFATGNPGGLNDSTWFYDNGPHYAFPSKDYMFDLWSAMDAIDQGSATKVRRGIARYDGTGSITYTIPAQWDSQAFGGFGNEWGGDAITVGATKKVVAAWAASGNNYTHVDLDSTTFSFRINLSTSDDDGATWSNFDSVPLTTMPGLGTKRFLWSYAQAGNAQNGTVLLDSMGRPHVFCVLQSEPFLSSSTAPVIAECYKDYLAGDAWKGKIIGPYNPQSRRTYGGFDQFGNALSAARTKDGTAFFVSYGNGPSGTTLESDIYVSGRYWKTTNWKNPINLTETPGTYEVANHLASIAPNTGGFGYKMCLTYASNPPGHETEDGNVSTTSFWFGGYDIDVTPVNFDYTWDGFNTINGRSITPDTTFDSLQATIRNNGEQPQFSSFEVRYRILKENTVLYAESLTTAGLALQESRTITWPGTFQPGDTGNYAVEVLIKAGDQVADNDTLYGSFYVVYPSPIALSIAQKFASTYTEITGTSTGLHNDDTTWSTSLPFSFIYDGFAYDSITFSTNGWVELGTIDTTDSVQMLHRREGPTPGNGTGGWANDEYAIKATDLRRTRVSRNTDPNKVFGAWVDDQSTQAESEGGDSADISYTTLGTTPNRSFVIQWKNMAARYEDENRGTRINYQVRLYEKSNMIEYCYGEMVAVPFATEVETDPEFGASIAMADSLRGPFHYFDIYKYITTGYGYGDYNFLKQNLHPINDWPGPDSVIRMAAGSVQYTTTSLNARWNMISNPTSASQPVAAMFPGRLINTTYLYSGSYSATSTLTPGVGYWTKFGPSPSVQVITGAPLLSNTVTLTAGWNLIGSIGHDVPAPPIAGNITGNTYGYNGSYVVAPTIKPGKAYWVKSSGGSLTLGSVNAPKAGPENFDLYSNVTIVDKNGSKQTLYLKQNSEEGLDLERYEMPPSLPSGNFDVRFKSNRILEAYPSDIQSAEKYPIAMQSPEYPITISWDIKNASGKGFGLEITDVNGKVTSQHTMTDKGVVTLAKGVNTLSVTVGSGPLVPSVFALGQNYPNPFNPTTRFAVDVPKTAVVDVAVYDILGRKVATLFSGEKSAGYYTVEWEGVNTQNQAVSSGIYFIRMTSDQFSAVRKVMMMK